MFRFIEPLENRALLSVTAAQLTADADALSAASASTTAAYAALHQAELTLVKTIRTDVKQAETKADRAADEKLLADLSKATSAGDAKVKSALNMLTSLGKSGARTAAATGKALLAHPQSPPLRAKAARLVTLLNSTIADRFSQLQSVEATTGIPVNLALSNIGSAVPSIAGDVQPILSAAMDKANAFDSLTGQIQPAAAQLAADLAGF